ncbi:MAG: Uncharacterized protein involved in outer membrane bioproteinis-like [bacterium]|nr:MAG: hypothetical protein FD142_1670 [bacterium]KAF0148515.1 MAG: Uncharacterized protein involved in outer membrane bioproteinis-like [bacterium]KAF0168059.1 MAG: Uncharacterized protein involved in outer membrane bioproteinis-like [bacterium]TXT21195.1 MAG: hypothetical protein FD132_705 [bacterium]
MSKSPRTLLFALGALIGFPVLVAFALLFFLDVNVYKPRFEAAASRAFGLEVHAAGRLEVVFFPGLLVKMEDVHIRNRGEELAAAKQVRLKIDFLPLLRNEIRIEKIVLEHPSITIERDREGRFNFEKPETAGGRSPAQDLPKIFLSDGSLRYTDTPSGKTFSAGNCSLDVSHMRLAEHARAEIMKALSLTAELACGELQTTTYTASDLKISVTGENGVFVLKPATMRVFGGQAAGSIQADFAGAVPVYQIRYSHPQFHIEEFLKTLSSHKLAEGSMDFSMSLSMRGKTVKKLKQSAQGQISLRGRNLILNGRDLDREFARFDSSQHFNLVDVGAYFFAGPFGLVLTKGYSFARIFQGSGGHSQIRTLVSDWKVEHGVAHAQDVAMATNENRVALQGALDLVNERFNDVTLALIDAKGCAKARQKIRGTFQKPLAEKPSTLESLAGPLVKLFNRARGAFPGGDCEVFYAGSVAPPG